MSTATVTENIVALEPVARDDFADEPVRAAARTERLQAYRSVPVARRQTV
jgi:hypothetical protein